MKFSDASSIALGLTDPTSAAVNTAINSGSPGRWHELLCRSPRLALSLVNATTNGHKIVVFASNGVCNTGANVTGPAGALAAAGAVVQSIAIGAGSSCSTNGGAGTLNQIAQSPGVCTAVPNPNDLPDIIQDLIGSTLESLTLSVDGSSTPISNTEIDPDLPQPGVANVTYATTAQDLAPGAHTICVTAAGSDVLGDSKKAAEACVTVQVVQLTATPATATNELGSDNQHKVTATIAGDPSVIAGRTVTFVVGGKNAGATGTCSPNADCTTNAAGQVTFTYTVPKADSSLGTDTIDVSAQLGTPAKVTVTVEKIWVETTPPVLACAPSVNPSGKNVPGGSNEDGYYLLTATDAVTAEPNIVILVNELGRADGSPSGAATR